MPRKNPEENKLHVFNRRAFCQLAGTSACVVAAGGAAALSADYLRPRALFEPPTRFKAGAAEAYTPGAVVTDDLNQVFVMRFAEGFRALSAVCTHLGCITRYNADQTRIDCPCHGSRFNLDGDVVAGPAPRALPWYQMELSSDGQILVDRAIEVPQGTIFRL